MKTPPPRNSTASRDVHLQKIPTMHCCDLDRKGWSVGFINTSFQICPVAPVFADIRSTFAEKVIPHWLLPAQMKLSVTPVAIVHCNTGKRRKLNSSKAKLQQSLWLFGELPLWKTLPPIISVECCTVYTHTAICFERFVTVSKGTA